jgi:hypothetical protein
MKLGEFMAEPSVCQSLNKFGRSTFYSEDPDVFSVWRGHIHRIQPPEELSENLHLIQPFLDHVRNIICNRDERNYNTEMKKNAWIFQNPAKHLRWATVLISIAQGTGKTVFYTDVLCSLWGADWSEPNVNKMEEILGEKAQAMTENRKLIVCNELSSGDSRSGSRINWDAMKSRITDDVIRVRGMYKDRSQIPIQNMANYIFASNHTNSIVIEEGDRRYFPLQVSEEQVKNAEYFIPLAKSFEHPLFRSTLLSYLLNLDVSDFDPDNPPMTELKESMTDATRSNAESFVVDRSWYFETDSEETSSILENKNNKEVNFDYLWRRYNDWLEKLNRDGSKWAGDPNAFYSKIRNWVDEIKIGGKKTYRPNKKLLRRWEAEVAEEFIVEGKWANEDKNKQVPFPDVWDKFETWVKTKGLDELKGAKMGFFSKVSKWVVTKKVGKNHVTCYSPSEELLKKAGEENEEE